MQYWDEIDIGNSWQKFQSSSTEYMYCSRTHGPFTMIDHTLGHKKQEKNKQANPEKPYS